MNDTLNALLQADEIENIGVGSMTEAQRQALVKWGTRMYSLGQHIVGEIEDIKYEGRLIILNDGTRWEVDPIDASTADLWSPMSKVVVIDSQMYILNDLEKVEVQEEL